MKQMMSSFTGCPSAEHFAAVWGFNVDDSGSVPGHHGQFGPESCVSSDSSAVKLRGVGSAVKRRPPVVPPEGGFSSQQHKVCLNVSCSSFLLIISFFWRTFFGCRHNFVVLLSNFLCFVLQILGNDQHEQHNYMIKQQILELEKLQLTEGKTQPSLMLRRHGEAAATSSSTHSSPGKFNESLDQRSEELDNCLSNALQSFTNASQELKAERFPSPISQLDQLPGSSVGEPFWQYKSPVDSSQVC